MNEPMGLTYASLTAALLLMSGAITGRIIYLIAGLF
jgi:uncharacterized membrane protein YuzA (DUF378 family)